MSIDTSISLAIHTDAPVMALAQMIAESAIIEVGRAARGGPDCMEGWAEEQTNAWCRPHHVVYGADNDTMQWIAGTLVVLGYDVVVTVPTGGDQFGDHQEVTEGIARRYTRTHDH
ncbi:MAG TPA: hypothetical protein VMT27_06700 [Actinomycetes bacterium]|nr:hypothetical protein [Actinomycetes bacterium]